MIAALDGLKRTFGIQVCLAFELGWLEITLLE
jgi:hypothetical protein